MRFRVIGLNGTFSQSENSIDRNRIGDSGGEGGLLNMYLKDAPGT